MDIKAGLVGAGAVVLLIGGGLVAAGIANADDTPAPVVSVEPTIEPAKVAPPAPISGGMPATTPVATPAPVVVPFPTPEVVVPEPAPEPVVKEPVTEPEPETPPVDGRIAPPRDLDLGSPPPPLNNPGEAGTNG